MIVPIAFALALQSAPPVIVENPPPYLSFMAEAEEHGRAAYLGGYCAGIGFIYADPAGLEEMGSDFDRRSTAAGTDSPVIDRAFQAGMDREKEAVRQILARVPASATGRQRQAQVIELLQGRCAALTREYPAAFRLLHRDS